MPRKGTNYALLQMKYARENKMKEISSHRDRARVVEQYTLASRRNDLEVERHNLRHYAQRLPAPIQTYYFDRINDFTSQIDTSKKRPPQYSGHYDEY